MTSMHLLASANSPASSFDDLRLVLFGTLAFAVLALLAFLPVRLAHRRHHRFTNVLTALLVLWALVALAAILLTISQNQQWSREDTLLLQSGYYDPRSHQHDPPTQPWPLWIILTLTYLALLTWSLTTSSRQPRETQPPSAPPC